MGRKKSATQILPALMCGQACLTHRDAHTFEQTSFQVQPPLGVAAAHFRHGRAGQQLSVVEAPLPLLGRMHRHRDHQHLRSHFNKGFQGISQENTQSAGDGLHSLVLEQMDQRA